MSDIGREITDEINDDPEEAERLRESLREAAAGLIVSREVAMEEVPPVWEDLLNSVMADVHTTYLFSPERRQAIADEIQGLVASDTLHVVQARDYMHMIAGISLPPPLLRPIAPEPDILEKIDKTLTFYSAGLGEELTVTNPDEVADDSIPYRDWALSTYHRYTQRAEQFLAEMTLSGEVYFLSTTPDSGSESRVREMWEHQDHIHFHWTDVPWVVQNRAERVRRKKIRYEYWRRRKARARRNRSDS